MMQSWENTHKALKSFAEELACSKCLSEPVIVTRYLNCGHIFCNDCIGSGSRCIKCNAPVQPTEIYHDNVFTNIINGYKEIAALVKKRDLWNAPVAVSQKSPKDICNTSLTQIRIGKSRLNPKTIAKNINKVNPRGETLLHSACLKNDEESVRHLLEAGANPNTKDHANWTPLQEVVSYGYTNLCRLLLESGANPNMPGNENRTALHGAVIDERFDEVKILLEHKANLNVFDQYGRKPRHYAKSSEMEALLNIKIESSEILDKTADTTCISDLSFSTAQNKNICVYAPKLSKDNQELLARMASKHGIKTVSTFESSVTHVVLETHGQYTTNSSYDVLMAIVRGNWLLDTEWIALVMLDDDINNVDSSIFELEAAPVEFVPRKARMNAQSKNPGLFDNCNFFFAMQSKTKYYVGDVELTKESLKKLVTEGGGAVLTREPESTETVTDLVPFHVANNSSHPLYTCIYYIIYAPGQDEPRRKYNMPHMKSLPLIWLTESIERFTLVNPAYLGI